MERTSCYKSLPQFINWDALPQYYYSDAQLDTDYNMCCAEPIKYYEASVRREYKDLVFRLLMQDKKNLLSVYNALNNTDYENVDELRIVTLEDAVYMKYKNDVSFLFQVVAAVDECIQGDILKDFLLKQKAEVIETLLFEYNEEEALKAMKQQEYENGLEEGKAEGKAEGEIKGKKMGIQAFVNLSKEVGLTKEEIISRVEAEFLLEGQEAKAHVERFWESA